ncbi:hypothetical protein SDC9_167169 [bioreactor metagenome]|uniref:Uncharacterized protein n=1 Tax=bioreactor metagenome TaxID=1076179 RepID=A0A645FZ31_9ZZZZ
MAHRGFQQRLRRRFTVFFLQIFFQRSGVNSDTNRDILVARAIHHHADTLFIADVAWINTQAVNAVFRHFERNTVVEVNVGDQRNRNLLLDQFEGFCGIHRGYGDTNNVSANTFQRFDLINRRFHVRGPRVGHRLDGDGSPIANRHIPNVNSR